MGANKLGAKRSEPRVLSEPPSFSGSDVGAGAGLGWAKVDAGARWLGTGC